MSRIPLASTFPARSASLGANTSGFSLRGWHLGVMCGALVAAAVGCGGTVVFEEDGASDGGGGAANAGPTGSGGAPTTTTASANPTTTNATTISSGPSPTGVTVGGTTGVTVGVTTGGSTCSEQLFSDPDLDACSREYCCAQVGTCLADPFSCFDESGQFALDLPAGAALYECLVDGACLMPIICDSGLVFGDSEPETIEIAICLSNNCCAEFNACTSDGADVRSCIDCLNGDLPDFGLCQTAIECANAVCDAGI